MSDHIHGDFTCEEVENLLDDVTGKLNFFTYWTARHGFSAKEYGGYEEAFIALLATRGRPLRAPFTPEQIAALNDWQSNDYVHPYTCGNYHEGHRKLIARPEGWICPTCDYTQSWAHDFSIGLADDPTDQDPA